jgi:hypothetical protein
MCLPRRSPASPAAIACLLLMACGGEGATELAVEEAPEQFPTTMTLSPTVLTFSSLGEIQGLSASVYDQNGDKIISYAPTWIMSTDSVLTLQALVSSLSSNNGQGGNAFARLTAVAEGIVMITAVAGPDTVVVRATVAVSPSS